MNSPQRTSAVMHDADGNPLVDAEGRLKQYLVSPDGEPVCDERGRRLYYAFDAAGDPVVEWSSPETLPQGGAFRGKDGVLEFFQGVGTAWESLHIDTETIDELGTDGVIGIIRGSGSLHGGAPAEYGAVHIFAVRGGKITRFREYVDLARPISP